MIVCPIKTISMWSMKTIPRATATIHFLIGGFGGGGGGARGAESDNYIAIYCWQIVNGFELSHGIYLTTSESQMVELTFAIPERSH